MNVMVIGAGGSIGRAVLSALVSRGHQAFGVSRNAPSNIPACAQGLIADRANVEAIASLIRVHRIDTVIDMVAYAEPSTNTLLDAIDHLTDRYVLISSADVYRNYGLLHRLEAGTPDMDELTEEAALRTSRYPYRGGEPRPDDDPAQWMDAYDKIPLEAATRLLNCHWTILRLPMVFGPDDTQQRFRWALQPMMSEVERLDLPSAWLDWTTTYGHVDNVGDAIAHSAGSAETRRGTFNIVDTQPASHSVWLQRFAAAAQWTGKVGNNANPDHPVAQATRHMDLNVPLKVSGHAFKTVSKWAAPLTLDIIVERTLEDATRRWRPAK